jgi:predicted Fe-Mo cluster-binding NifX family protein
MTVCIPVEAPLGTASPICAHFGSAPYFLIVDTDDGSSRVLPNRNQHHAHGMCQPLAALQGERIDAFVLAGIGMGALNKLLSSGLRVFHAPPTTVEHALAALTAGELRVLSPDEACGHHGQGHGHVHGHRHALGR